MKMHSSLLALLSWLLAMAPSAVVADRKHENVPPSKNQDDDAFDFSSYFVHKSVIIPHDEKKHRGGEDAAATSAQFLVVADGVGGWAKHDVNPGLYSRLLTTKVVELGTGILSKAPLQQIVHKANWMAADQHLGSATCTTLKLTGPNEITALNIGDSGYSIHRRQTSSSGGGGRLEVVFASEPGQKRFNFPHQLGGKYGDEVKDVAVEKTHMLEPDDIIVVYSDGVSDNIFPAQFHSCLESATDEDAPTVVASLSLAADCIARKAYFLGKDKTFDSPFAQGARQAGWGNYQGGKHDDITVVVAQIREGKMEPVYDPYLKESIYLYTGKVQAVEELPSLEDLMIPSLSDEL